MPITDTTGDTFGLWDGLDWLDLLWMAQVILWALTPKRPGAHEIRFGLLSVEEAVVPAAWCRQAEREKTVRKTDIERWEEDSVSIS